MASPFLPSVRGRHLTLRIGGIWNSAIGKGPHRILNRSDCWEMLN
jgi:hypothetical protein